ncbi:hypothetical protein [Leptodesmis sichuanensis]|uniref:hypothetical protein n=1 Tax=Leptodesmis sichuanensis TaxID=2906798 RepID=UPI001F211B33|nr:hypothetical protein [Leptodesmis sichuanensis]UIE37168.1 hypothetical protein KIK02_19710 [Leptodesmis sichuanensis A121]
MLQLFPLAPRYRLDDEQPWLEGIDPSRHYWIRVNGHADLIVAIPGLAFSTMDAFRETILAFRSLQPGETMALSRVASTCTIHCISQNCYAIATEIAGAPIWHLFDQETLESLLMTGHPDWKCSPKDVDLGRRMLARSWNLKVAA